MTHAAMTMPPGKPLLRRSTRRGMMIWAFLAPSLLIFLLYRILPLAWNIVLSFEAWSPQIGRAHV